MLPLAVGRVQCPRRVVLAVEVTGCAVMWEHATVVWTQQRWRGRLAGDEVERKAGGRRGGGEDVREACRSAVAAMRCGDWREWRKRIRINR